MSEKVRFTKDVKIGGKKYSTNDTGEFSEDTVKTLVEEKGIAVRIGDEIEDLEELDKKKNGGDTGLQDWAKTSTWLSAEDVEKGDTMAILSEHEMKTYEGNESPVIEVEHDGIQANLRLNKGNTQNIADEYSWDSEEWIGEQIKVVSIQNYPGVNAKGMILEPVRD